MSGIERTALNDNDRSELLIGTELQSPGRRRSKMTHLKYVCSIVGFLILVQWNALAIDKSGEAVEQKPLVASIGGDGIQRIDIVGGEYFFRPGHVVVKVNVPVELRVSKEGGMTPHDIVMKSTDAGMEFSESLSTTPKTITFTPTKPGTYPFYCSKRLPFVKSHRERGMEGVLEVTP
jgi:plastocyanin